MSDNSIIEVACQDKPLTLEVALAKLEAFRLLVVDAETKYAAALEDMKKTPDHVFIWENLMTKADFKAESRRQLAVLRFEYETRKDILNTVT